MSARNNLLRRLAGSSCGASTFTLWTSAQALVYSAAKYASPVWCRSSHVKKLNVTLNDTMRLITGCFHPTPTKVLPVLSGFTPAPLHREHHTLTLITKALTYPRHLLHDLLEQSNLLGQQRLKSRHPFSRHAVRLVNSQFDICESSTCTSEHSPQHSPTSWSWASKERMCVLESSMNWCWWLWCIYVPLGTAAVSCLSMQCSWADHPTPDGWVPRLQSTCGLEPLSSWALHKGVVMATREYYIILSHTRRC